MRRSDKLELIDLGPDHYTQEEYNDCLKQLGRIGKLFGGNKTTDRTLNRIDHPVESILDIGCGGGQAAARLARRYPEAQVAAIDMNPSAVAYAKEHHDLPNLSFEVQKEKRLDYSERQFDLVHCSLVCHHISWEELPLFIQEAHRVCKGTIVINELRRSRIAWTLYAVSAPLLFRNRLITHDGLLSICRSFVRPDWKRLEEMSALAHTTWSVYGHPLFRWGVTIERAS